MANRLNTPTTQSDSSEYEKAISWLNVYATTKDGVRHKVGKKGIPLLASDPVMKRLHDLLAADADLSGSFSFEWQPAGVKLKPESLDF